MSNHFSDPDLVPQALLDDLSAKLEEARVKTLGATGRFPEGKLGEFDEGEIAFAVAADPRRKKVLINFGKPVAFLGMTREQAAGLAHLLIQKAMEIE